MSSAESSGDGSKPAKSSIWNLNHNVKWALILCVFYGMADNLWSGTVFAAYLKAIYGEENAAVGYVEGANGMAGLVTALPIGYLADRYPRSLICKYGGVALILTAIAHSCALFYIGDEAPSTESKKNEALVIYLVIMFLWGSAGGVVNGPVQALYADSTPPGERTMYYTYLFASYTLASCIGPLISICLFLGWGNDWSLDELKDVILVGMGLEVFAACCMFPFDDKKALKEPGEEISGEGECANADCKSVEESPASDERKNTEGDEALEKRRSRIPYILFCSDMLVSLGSGMTVKFFPLFFKDDCELSPVTVQVIYLIVPLFMIVCAQCGSAMSKTLGRVQTILSVKTIGLSFLFSIVFFQDYLIKRPALLIPIYILRTGLMNSTYPLQESILMDFVPKDQRARWKSLESVSAFGWCGSAALGGVLADKYDYPFTFLLTACIQSFGTSLYLFLLPLVPRSEKALTESRMSRGGSTADLTEPLLRERDEGSMQGVV